MKGLREIAGPFLYPTGLDFDDTLDILGERYPERVQRMIDR